MKRSYVYLLASSRNGTLYCGVTSDLPHRIHKHRTGEIPGFTSRYQVTQLVWFEEHGDITTAIHRETQIKRWQRAWKIALIEAFNPDWRDLYPSLLPGPERTHTKPPIIDPKRATRQQFATNDPFLTSFDER